jgi:hypothetical protein
MMEKLRFVALALAPLALFAFAAGVGARSDPRSSAERFRTVPVHYSANAGSRNERILRLGGLVVRASCTDYGQGRIYLSAGARTLVDDTARALVLGRRDGGQAETYGFSSGDFDRDFGWYDLTGPNPDRTTGTFSYARPDGGQISLTFRADEAAHGADCRFDGTVLYAP